MNFRIKKNLFADISAREAEIKKQLEGLRYEN